MPRKGSKAFWNTETGEEKRFMENPGFPWEPGLSPSHRKNLIGHNGTKGMKVYHNLLTGQHSKFYKDPGYPWVRGHSTVAKKAMSESRLAGDFKLSEEAIQKIKKKLTGRNYGWREGVSKACSRRAECDSIYLLKLKKNDKVIGKWGSTTRDSFCYREREFARHGFHCEVLMMVQTGPETPEEEARIGRVLSKHPPIERPEFYGKTETFEWCEDTIEIVQIIINSFNS
jgi:hypothetical protein